MVARVERMMNSLDEIRVTGKVAHVSFSGPTPRGKTPLNTTRLTKIYGSLEVFAGMNLAIGKGSRVVTLGFDGVGKTTLLKPLASVGRTDGEGSIVSDHDSRTGYFV